MTRRRPDAEHAVPTPAVPTHVGRTLICLVALLGMSGCAALGRINPFGGADDATGPSPLMEFEPEAEIVRDWSTGVGAGLGERSIRIVPAVGDERVYAADAYGRVQAYARADGETVWRSRIGEPQTAALAWLPLVGRDDDGGSFLTGGVGLGERHVFVGTTRGEVIALRRDDGGEAWRERASSEVVAAPAAEDGVVTVQSTDGHLSARNSKDGSQRWSYSTQVPVLSLRGDSAPVISGPMVITGFASGKVVAIRSADGSIAWQHQVALPKGRSELERMRDVEASPLVARNAVFVASYHGAVKALRPSDGGVLWERQFSAHRALARGYGQLYVIDEEDVLHALDQQSGDEVWQQPGLARRQVTGAAVLGPYLALADAQGYVHVFAQSDGRPIARTRFDGAGIRSHPVAAGDQLFVLSNDGRLGALRIERPEG